MPDLYDPFDDVKGAGDLGSLQGVGATEHYRARVEQDPEGNGVAYSLQCDHCGQPNRVTLEWAELVVCGNGALPANWRYEAAHGAAHPNVGCRQCRHPLLLLVTPDECARHVKAGVAAGKISPQQVQGLSQQVQAQLAQYRR